MEAHFLRDMVTGDPEFSDEPWYNIHGDCIVHKISPEAVVADRLDDFLTLYRSAEDNRVIGYQIKGVRALVNRFGWEGLVIQCAQDDEANQVVRISVAALLLAAFGDGPNTVGRRLAYAETLRGAASKSIPQSDLVAV